MSALIELDGVTRVYGTPPVAALQGVTMRIDEGEFVAVTGASGSGKSTLLNLIGTLDRPTTGRVRIGGVDTGVLGDAELSVLRARRIGFVFQQFHLREGVAALDNVADGLLYTGTPRADRRRRAERALDRVGLGHRVTHHPHQMSGGERQRVAIARAVVADPPILLADEPTGNLDSLAGTGVIELLHTLNAAGTTVLVITHDPQLAARLPRRITVGDGLVRSDSKVPA